MRTCTSLCALVALVPTLLSAADKPAAPDLWASTPQQSVLSAMDRSANPCNEFYRYACGGWDDMTTIPSDQARWSRSFSVIAEHNREMIRTLLEDAAKSPGAEGTERAKIGHFYSACMDEAAVEKAGLAPIHGWLEAIAKVDSTPALFKLVGELDRAGAGAFFGVGIFPDFKTPTVNISYFFQGGLGLPDRDYYVSQDPKKQEILKQYQAHVARMLTLAGQSEESAASDAAAIVAFETELAKVSLARASRCARSTSSTTASTARGSSR